MHETLIDFTEVGSGITHVLDFSIPVLKDLHASGWYSGNTHTHYHLEIDEDPDDRLRMVPPAEALDVSVISYLIRGDSPYITTAIQLDAFPSSLVTGPSWIWEKRRETTGPSPDSDMGIVSS